MKFTVKDILAIEVAPALGCTEPAAIAFGAATAATALPRRDVRSIEIWVDPNIYKNGMAAAIPGTPGLTGLDMAAALGAIGGDPSLRLEVLEAVNQETISQARALLAASGVRVHLLQDHRGLYVRTRVQGPTETAECIIADMHDNIVSLTLDNEPVHGAAAAGTGTGTGNSRLAELEAWLKDLSLNRLLDLLDELDDEDLAFLEEGIRVNVRLADYGLKHGPGLGIGRALERLARQGLVARDMILAAKITTSAAADARMGGVKLPAMSSAGSGNHGLTAILPIWAIRDFVNGAPRTVLEAVGLSHIITAYVKAYTGRLSAVCGCSIAAGAGAAAGVTYLLGGNVTHIAGAITNLTEDLAGVICDGAKAGCAFKLATAAGVAVQAALFALQGISVQPTDGIIGNSMEQTAKNIGALSTQGMIDTDRTILKIMLEKRFSGYR